LSINKSEKELPCPFCGNKKVKVTIKWGLRFCETYITCLKCYAQGPLTVEGGKKEAITLWNSRKL